MPKVPNLRFPAFEGDEDSSYKKYYFKDIFHFSTGKNIKQNEASPEFDIPCVRYGELYHLYSEVITEVVNKTNLDKSELLYSDGDEILLPSAGEDPLDIGSASALTIKNVAIGRTINILKPAKANVYSQLYVAYYINQRLRKTISTLAKGVSISNVYNSDLRTLEIILPNLPEQTQVAGILCAIDKRIQDQIKIISQLETLMQGLREQVFKQKLRFKDENGNDFPEWEEKMLGEVLMKNSNKNKRRNHANVQSISNKYGFINQDEFFEERRVASIDTSNYYVIEKGFFAYNPSRINVGSLAYKSDDNISIVSPLYVSFKAKNEFLFDAFLLNWFKTVEFTKQMNNSFEGSVRNTLSYENLAGMIVSTPCVQEQVHISSVLFSIGNKIDTEKKILEKYEAQKRYLLQNLFI